MRLTAEQIEQIVHEIEALEYGEVLIRVLGPGRPIRVRVTRSIALEIRCEEALDAHKITR